MNTIKVAPSFNVFAGFCSDLKFCHLYDIKVCFSPCFSCSIFSGRTSPNYLVFYKLFHFSTMDGVSDNWNPLKFTEKRPPTACEAAAQQEGKHLHFDNSSKNGAHTEKCHTQNKKNNVQSSFSAYIFSQTFFFCCSFHFGGKDFFTSSNYPSLQWRATPKVDKFAACHIPPFFHAGIDTAWNAVMA